MKKEKTSSLNIDYIFKGFCNDCVFLYYKNEFCGGIKFDCSHRIFKLLNKNGISLSNCDDLFYLFSHYKTIKVKAMNLGFPSVLIEFHGEGLHENVKKIS